MTQKKVYLLRKIPTKIKFAIEADENCKDNIKKFKIFPDFEKDFKEE
jgi:hypothetical protein